MQFRLKEFLKMGFFVLVGLLVLDLVLAQLAKRTMKIWHGEFMRQEASILTPVYHHGRKPYADFIYRYGNWESPYYTNSLGFRDISPLTIPLKSDKYRVMFIGDSITEGVGVSYEKTFVGNIAKNLSANGIEILNAAIERYANQVYDAKTRHFIETVKLEVDEVVVVLDVGDIANDAVEHRTDERGNVVSRERMKYSQIKRFKFWLKDNSILYRLYRKKRDRKHIRKLQHDNGSLQAAIGTPGVKWTLDSTEYSEYAEEGMKVADRAMTNLAKFLAARKIHMTIVVFPWPVQIVNKDLDSLHVRFWRNWATKNGVDFINMFPDYINDRDPEQIYQDFYIPYDFHFNTKGHAYFASKFLNYFKSGAVNRSKR